MAIDSRAGKKTPSWVNRETTAGTRIDHGPFIGIVKDNVDPARLGRLRVYIPEISGKDPTVEDNWIKVEYASPFAGQTPGPGATTNNRYDSVKHTYGFWAVPPDLENQVLVMFTLGDQARGFYFACLHPNLSNHMTPGLATAPDTDSTSVSDTIKSAVGKDSVLPVAEFNVNDIANNATAWVANKKPVHDAQAQVLINQGLDRDAIRGAITSSSQREAPSAVFGMSTPGRPLQNDPADDPNFASKVSNGTYNPADYNVTSRKGGHTFVMDDGDINNKNKLVRLRTSGGHQIMMNDSEDIVYIANMDGSCYIEFTGEGYINIYGQRSISIRSEKDVNIHADNDINLNAQNTIRMHSNTSIETETDVAADLAITGKISKAGYIDMKSDSSLRIETVTYGLTASDSLLLDSNNGGWIAAEGLLFQSAVGGWTTSDGLAFNSANGSWQNTGTLALSSTGGGWADSGANLTFSGGKIYLNTNAAPATTTPDTPPSPDTPNDVALFDFDNGLYRQDDTSLTTSTGKWDTVSQSVETISAIMPAHEPWVRVSGTNNVAEIDNLVNQKPVPTPKSSAAPPNTSLTTPTDTNTGQNTSSVLPSSNLTDGLGNPMAASAVSPGIASAINVGIPNPAGVSDLLGSVVPGGFSLNPTSAAASIASAGVPSLNQLTNSIDTGASSLLSKLNNIN
jgi:hypothetical protein